MKLSIVVVTMNRAEQLKSALQSCVNSKLPEDVEFIIVDNASTDNTKEIVKTFFDVNNYSYKYELEHQNLGVGGGRNRGFDLAIGEYVYFLDDDAIIADDSYEEFFMTPIRIFETDVNIASITTRIYDELLGCDRDVRISKRSKNEGVSDILMYLGGSHFLRRKYYTKPLYLEIKYGMEEILPSIIAIDKGWRNCFINDVTLLHQPKRNKWISNSIETKNLAIGYNVNMYCAKKILYPWYMQFIIFVAFWIRNINHLGFNLEYLGKAQTTYKRMSEHKMGVDKISLNTIISIARDYSISALV